MKARDICASFVCYPRLSLPIPWHIRHLAFLYLQYYIYSSTRFFFFSERNSTDKTLCRSRNIAFLGASRTEGIRPKSLCNFFGINADDHAHRSHFLVRLYFFGQFASYPQLPHFSFPSRILDMSFAGYLFGSVDEQGRLDDLDEVSNFCYKLLEFGSNRDRSAGIERIHAELRLWLFSQGSLVQMRSVSVKSTMSCL